MLLINSHQKTKPEYDRLLGLTSILQKIQGTEECGDAMSKILIVGNFRTNGLVSSKIHYKRKKVDEKSRE